MLAQIFKIEMQKIKVFLLLYRSKITNAKTFNQDIITVVINYLKRTGCFDRSIINFTE